MVALEKVPPHDDEAERALLGCILFDGEVLADIHLEPGDFYSGRNQTIYRTLRDVWQHGEPIDIALVAERLESAGIPRDYLAEVASSVRTPVHALKFSERVGSKAKARALIHLAGKYAGLAYEPCDAMDLVRSMSDDLMVVGGEASAGGDMDPRATVEKVLEDCRNGTGRVGGVSTGYPYLDYMTLGLRPGDLWIVAGRPSMGKSSFANNVALNMAREGKRVAIFTLEVPMDQVVKNLISIGSGVGLQKIISGTKLDDEAYGRAVEAVEPLLNRNIFICDDGRITTASIRSKARGLKRKHGLDLIVVDYIGLMEGGGSGNRQQDISNISRGLKLLARELEVPVVCLSQLNRGVESREDKRPRLSDLRDSGSLEQDADVVALMFRSWYYTRLPAEERAAEVIIAKQRNGPTGTVMLDFQADCVRFSVPSVR